MDSYTANNDNINYANKNPNEATANNANNANNNNNNNQEVVPPTYFGPPTDPPSTQQSNVISIPVNTNLGSFDLTGSDITPEDVPNYFGPPTDPPHVQVQQAQDQWQQQQQQQGSASSSILQQTYYCGYDWDWVVNNCKM